MFDCLAMGNEQVWRKQLPVTVTFDEITVFVFISSAYFNTFN